MEKKKIFITTHTMRIGGVERSLVGLLNALDYDRFDVDLFLFLHDGEMLSLIPKEVNVLNELKEYAGMILPVKENLRKGNLNILFVKQRAKSKAKHFIKKNNISDQNLVYDNYLQKFSLKYLPKISSNKKYDLAISFLTPHYVVAEKVHASKKIAWIHTDYSFFDFDRDAETEMWAKYDAIASISENCTQGFIKQFPSLESKIILIENVLDEDFLRKSSVEFSVDHEMRKEKDVYNLLSVGRFSHQKNFDNIPAITRSILENGVQVKWFIIGYGSGEEVIRKKIEEYEMQNYVIILGKKENPYPYMLACDFYIQPSRYEGKAVTVREAQMLAKPVIITNFSTSNSQLKMNFDGVIVPMSNSECAMEIVKLIKNKSKINKLIENCKNSDYSNREEIEKICNFLA